MLPQSQRRKPRNSSKVNLIISVAFHGAIAAILVYFAAREGYLGKTIKKIAVEMVKEKKEEKPKEPEKPKEEIPKQELPKVAPKLVEVPKDTPAPPPAATIAAAPPTVAPAAVEVPSFAFEGGKAVESSSDPVQLYKGLLQYSFQSRWERPEDMDDGKFAVEVEVAVDRAGQISDAVWKKGSGNKRWDDSVRQALAVTKSVDRPPPSNFPPRVVVRFDVVDSETLLP